MRESLGRCRFNGVTGTTLQRALVVSFGQERSPFSRWIPASSTLTPAFTLNHGRIVPHCPHCPRCPRCPHCPHLHCFCHCVCMASLRCAKLSWINVIVLVMHARIHKLGIWSTPMHAQAETVTQWIPRLRGLSTISRQSQSWPVAENCDDRPHEH